MNMQVEVVHAKSQKSLAVLEGLSASSCIYDVKKAYQKVKPSLYPSRQSFRLEPRSKMLKDEDSFSTLGIQNKGKLYFKDLGPQISWTTVFLSEYAGPLFVYLTFYARPWFIYGAAAATEPTAQVVHIAAACWSFHYAKRLFETVFIHRFSHGTMPIGNLFKNCSYYWGFAALVAYYVNHPLYTEPGCDLQVYGALAAFIMNELGNFSIHVSLRNLRPPGTKERKIPYASANPFTWLFGLVSCPNYTYEVGAWISFSIMTQCLPAVLFAGAGFYQMAVWAGGKHRNYLKEFKDYPRRRKAIVPFLI